MREKVHPINLDGTQFPSTHSSPSPHETSWSPFIFESSPFQSGSFVVV